MQYIKQLFIFISLVIIIIPTTAHARKWKRINIPGAKCGSGLPYTVFYDEKETDKLAIEFMGGGACWNAKTCYGLELKTWLFPIPKLPAFSLISSENIHKSPAANHSMLYLPYCTGDVFAGRHKAKYGIFNVHHRGYDNVIKTLAYLKEQEIIDFDLVQDAIVSGTSAGGIAAIFHAENIDKYIPSNAKRTMFIDSAGLHFGEHFWKKFTAEQFADFQNALSAINLPSRLETGFMSPYIANFCNNLPDWNIGFLQSSQDIVMSEVFGGIDPLEHEKLIFGDRGLHEISRDEPNCSSWIPQSQKHTWLLTDLFGTHRIEGIDPIAFVFETYHGELVNYSQN